MIDLTTYEQALKTMTYRQLQHEARRREKLMNDHWSQYATPYHRTKFEAHRRRLSLCLDELERRMYPK